MWSRMARPRAGASYGLNLALRALSCAGTVYLFSDRAGTHKPHTGRT